MSNIKDNVKRTIEEFRRLPDNMQTEKTARMMLLSVLFDSGICNRGEPLPTDAQLVIDMALAMLAPFKGETQSGHNDHDPDTMIEIGKVAVDSGQLMVCDPTYAYKRLAFVGASRQFRTLDFKEATQPGYMATIIRPGWGDGLYPVQAVFNQHGRIAMISLVFDDEYLPTFTKGEQPIKSPADAEKDEAPVEFLGPYNKGHGDYIWITLDQKWTMKRDVDWVLREVLTSIEHRFTTYENMIEFIRKHS